MTGETFRARSSCATATTMVNWSFTQEDPAGLAGGLNAYGFASGDPVNYSDPFGLCDDPTKPDCNMLRDAFNNALGLVGNLINRYNRRSCDTARSTLLTVRPVLRRPEPLNLWRRIGLQLM